MAEDVQPDHSPATSLRELAAGMRASAEEQRTNANYHREVSHTAWRRAVELDARAAEHEAAAERLSCSAVGAR